MRGAAVGKSRGGRRMGSDRAIQAATARVGTATGIRAIIVALALAAVLAPAPRVQAQTWK